MGQLVPVVAGTFPRDVTNTSALVASLRPRIGAVLHDVTHLIAVVAGVFILAAVPRNVPSAVALVAAVLFLPALSSKVTEPVALVALGSTTTAAKIASTSETPSSIATATNITSTITLRALPGKVANPVTSVAN